MPKATCSRKKASPSSMLSGHAESLGGHGLYGPSGEIWPKEAADVARALGRCGMDGMVLQLEKGGSPLVGDAATALRSGLQHPPVRVMIGGSEAKNTQSESSDVDIVVVLKDFDVRRLPEYCQTAQQTLAKVGTVTLKLHRTTAHGMKINIQQHMAEHVIEQRDMDILFTGDPDDNSFGSPDAYYAGFWTIEQAKYVKEMTIKHRVIRTSVEDQGAGLRDVATWIKQAIDAEKLRINGYFIELLCVAAMDKQPDVCELTKRRVAADIVAKASQLCPTYHFPCPATQTRIGACAGSVDAAAELGKLSAILEAGADGEVERVAAAKVEAAAKAEAARADAAAAAPTWPPCTGWQG